MKHQHSFLILVGVVAAISVALNHSSYPKQTPKPPSRLIWVEASLSGVGIIRDSQTGREFLVVNNAGVVPLGTTNLAGTEAK